MRVSCVLRFAFCVVRLVLFAFCMRFAILRFAFCAFCVFAFCVLRFAFWHETALLLRSPALRRSYFQGHVCVLTLRFETVRSVLCVLRFMRFAFRILHFVRLRFAFRAFCVLTAFCVSPSYLYSFLRFAFCVLHFVESARVSCVSIQNTTLLRFETT